MQVQELVLLGLLMEKPRHGYELKRAVDRSVYLVADITSGTIYYTLSKLERDGLVNSVVDRDSGRPEKRIYSILPAGRERFRELLRESMVCEDRPFYLFDVGLFFMRYAAPEMVLEAIGEKRRQLKGYLEMIRRAEAELGVERWPFYLQALRDRGIMNVKTSSRFYRELARRIEKEFNLEKKGGGPGNKKS